MIESTMGLWGHTGKKYLESPMTLLNLPFQEKEVFERKHSFLHMSRNVPFLFVPCQILLRQCPETFFRRPKRVFLRPKGVFKRPCRTRPDEDSLCTFF